MHRMLHTARSLELDQTYLLATIAALVVSIVLLHCAAAWGVARSSRRTARAIEALERTRPPEGQT